MQRVERCHLPVSSMLALKLCPYLSLKQCFSYNVRSICKVSDCCRGSDGKFELDFESNPADIINSEHHEMDAVYRPVVDYKPEYRRSLRVSGDCLFCSVLISSSSVNY